MAKISANGCHEVARAVKTTDNTKVTIVLRSDNKVLRKVDVKHEADYMPVARWSYGTYTIIGALGAALDAKPEEQPLARFKRYATQRGFTV